MPPLTERQTDDLNKSILEYLHSQNLTEAFNALRTETKIDYTPDTSSKFAGLLEKKWVSVIRLQKKILDLENRNTALQEELKNSSGRRTVTQITDWTPREPALHTLTGHQGDVNGVAFHPLFNLLASAGKDTTVKIWDWESGTFERTLKGHTREVWDVDFSSNGQWLASASSDLTIRLWDTSEWDSPGYSPKTLRGHEHAVESARFLPGGEFIISASRDTTIKMWEVATTFCVRTFKGHAEKSYMMTAVPSSDGLLMASGSNDHNSLIWDMKTGAVKQELRGHSMAVEVVAFAPVAAYPLICELAGISIIPTTSGAFLATGARDKLVKLWDTQTGQEIRTFSGHGSWVHGLTFHPGGKYLLSAADDKTIRVWDLSSGRCMRTVEAHSHFVTSMAWGPPVARASGDKSNTGVEEPDRVNVVATCSVDQTIRVWTP